MNSVWAIIPARGGSKGIPHKNVRLLGGHPLVAHSIVRARQASRVSRVLVSTDSTEIAKISLEYGAQVIDRPAELAGDTATTESALLHVLQAEADEFGSPELVLLLQPTSPFRPEGMLNDSIDYFERVNADSLVSVGPTHGFVWERNGDRVEALTYEPSRRPRRQDIGEHWIENGSFYITRSSLLLQHENRIVGRTVLFEMDALDSFQIDSSRDFQIHEMLYPARGVRFE